MRKKYVIMLYVLVLLVASLGVSALVWKEIKNNTISEEYYEKYNEYKDKLIDYGQYSSESEDLDIMVEVYESNNKYLVSTTFTNPQNNYKNLIILVIDESERENETNKIYPSIGIVGNFNNEFVVSSPNKKTTHSILTLNYENDVKSKGVLIYLEYTKDNSTITSRLNVPVA